MEIRMPLTVGISCTVLRTSTRKVTQRSAVTGSYSTALGAGEHRNGSFAFVEHTNR